MIALSAEVKNIDRTNARLAAVQALYQLEARGQGVETVIVEFETHRLGGDLDGVVIHDADSELFSETVRGAVRLQSRIDPYIQKHLAENWTLKRINATARAILRAALTELVHTPETPVKVVIDEYIEIGKSFFDEAEIKFINGLLDSAAHDIRRDEFDIAANSS